MFRAEIVWAVVAAHGFAVATCPAETVLCRTFKGSVKVEVAVNGACSKRLHDSPGTSRASGGGSAPCSCTGIGRHGPCHDTLLSSRDDAVCSEVLLPPVEDAIEVAAAFDRGPVAARAVLAESADPSWLQPGLDMLRTVRLLA